MNRQQLRFASAIVAAVLLVFAQAGISSAQNNPNPTWLRFSVYDIKPEATQEFEGYLKQIAAANKTAGQFFAVLQNFSGLQTEYTTVTFVMKFADLEGPLPAQKQLGPEGFRNLISGMNRCVTSVTRYYSLPWDDLSIIKPGPLATYWLRTRTPVQPDKFDAYRAYLKTEIKPAYEKAGVMQMRTSRPIFGGPVGVVEAVRMLKGLGEIDEGPLNTRIFGKDAPAVAAKIAAMTRGPAQTTILRARPELSFIPDMAPTR
jgi:hypothetical protein